MMNGETILSGASDVCSDCGTKLVMQVMETCAPYIGTQCACGPYSRESIYFATREEAEAALKVWNDKGILKGARS